MRKFLILLAATFPHQPAQGKDQPPAETNNEEIEDADTGKTSGKLYYDRINARLRLSPAEGNYDLVYETFTDWVLGGSARYGRYGIGLETSWPRPDTETKARTSVKSAYITSDLDRWRSEIFWQSFQGFNLDEAGDELQEEDLRPQRSDIHANFYGLKAQWVKSPDDVWIPGQSIQFSTDPGWGYSFISGGRLANTEVTSDRPLIPDQYRERFQGEHETRGLTYTMAGADVGIAGSYGGSRLRVGAAVNAVYGVSSFRTYGTGFSKESIAAGLGTKLGVSFRLKRGELGVFGLFDSQLMGTEKIYYQIDREVIQTYAALWL